MYGPAFLTTPSFGDLEFGQIAAGDAGKRATELWHAGVRTEFAKQFGDLAPLLGRTVGTRATARRRRAAGVVSQRLPRTELVGREIEARRGLTMRSAVVAFAAAMFPLEAAAGRIILTNRSRDRHRGLSGAALGDGGCGVGRIDGRVVFYYGLATDEARQGFGRRRASADGGVENLNGAVDELIPLGLLRQALTQTEMAFLNSMIEFWWRVLKHQWLYLNTLGTVSSVEKLVAFYVQEHNTRLPYSAFRGQTPDEMYFGTGGQVPAELEAARQLARRA